MAADRQVSLEAVAALSSRLLDGGTLDEVLRHVCDAVVAEIDGAEEASVTLVNDRAAATYGATGGLPIEADERQYESGHGPCLDAAAGNQALIITDTHDDLRWKDILTALADAGVRSSMSVPLPVQGE